MFRSTCLILFAVLVVCLWGSGSPWEDMYFDNPAKRADAPEFTPDVEVWLNEKVGRFDGREFVIQGGSASYPTPKGSFWVHWKSRNHFSKQWAAPMPYAIFFKDGAALHVGPLYGGSHGCVRVSNETAPILFSRCHENRTRVVVYP